jgi:glycosyltransferase involved in cell wall biosynthesis
MKILFVDAGGGVGGSTISLYYLVRGLVAAGVEATVSFPWAHAWSPRFEALGARVRYEGPAPPSSRGAAPPAPGSAAAPSSGGVASHRRGGRPWTDHPAWRALHFYRTHWRTHAAARDRWVEIVRQVSPDLVYTNNDLPLNFDVVEAAEHLRLPVVCHLRGFQPIRLPHRRYAGKLRAGIAISEIVRRHYLDAGFDPAKIHRVYNGIDVGDYPWREPSLQVPASGGRLLFLGRLTGWKGAPVLLDAVVDLRARRPELTLAIAGDGPARSLWTTEVERRGLARAVTFSGFVSDVVAALHHADLLVHTSIEPEPFGRVLIEGMATGTPVVASDLGATREIIADGVSGRLVPAGQPALLARAIDELLSAGEERVELSRAARKRVEENFTVEKMVAGVNQVIRSVMGSAGASPGGSRRSAAETAGTSH